MGNTIKVKHKLGENVAIIVPNGDIINGVISKIEYSEELDRFGKSRGINESYRVRVDIKEGTCESFTRLPSNIYASREDAARAYLAKQQIKI